MSTLKHFKELNIFRELLFALTLREIKVRYKETIFGVGWAIIQPLSLMIVFTIIFSIFLKVETDGIPYPLFAYSGLLPWTFFTTSFSLGSLSVINNGNLVTKVYFPREILPLSHLGAALVDFLIATLIFIVLIFIYKIPITINFLLVIPLIGLLVLFTAAIVMFFSTLVVLWRDIKFIIPLLVQVWIFATPVIYPASKVPDKIRVFYTLDPIVPIINGFRSVTVLGKPPEIHEIATAIIVSTIFFIVSYLFFKSKERIFADII